MAGGTLNASSWHNQNRGFLLGKKNTRSLQASSVEALFNSALIKFLSARCAKQFYAIARLQPESKFSLGCVFYERVELTSTSDEGVLVEQDPDSPSKHMSKQHCSYCRQPLDGRVGKNVLQPSSF